MNRRAAGHALRLLVAGVSPLAHAQQSGKVYHVDYRESSTGSQTGDIRNYQDENMKKSDAIEGPPASELVSARIAELGGWRATTLGRMRKLVKEADPEVAEEWKWGIPVWSHDGIICTGESYKDKVKLTFAKGASLKDPAVSSTLAWTETYAARSTSTKEKKLTSPPSRHSFV